MPSPIVATWTPYGAYWPILTLIYFPLATCVKVSHLAPHFSHIRLASGEPDNSMDGLLSQILGKTYQLSSSCPHSTFLLHFFFENMLSLTRWHSMPNNLSNHSTDQITWEGYSNKNLVFLFEKTQSWDNSCFTSTSMVFSQLLVSAMLKNTNFSLCMYSDHSFYQNLLYIAILDKLFLFKNRLPGVRINYLLELLQDTNNVSIQISVQIQHLLHWMWTRFSTL